MPRYSRIRASTYVGALALISVACGEGGGGGAMEGGGDDSIVADCAEAETLIETTEWPICLAGVSLKGTEPFNNMPCELRIGNNGVFEYLRGGQLAVAVPDRSQWGAASGTYQNVDNPSGRLFLASISPDLPLMAGKARVSDVSISLFELESIEDKVEIKYFDENNVRQTYNCTVDEL